MSIVDDAKHYPPTHRLEEALKQRVFELEKKVDKLEYSLLNLASLHSEMRFFKHPSRTKHKQ